MIHLMQYQVIEIIGEDASKFLQGQLTCDVFKLEIGRQTLTAHCDAKGKVSSLFRLCKQADNQFLMVIHQHLLPDALDQLKKYAIFSKVTFTLKEYFTYGLNQQEISGDIFIKFFQNKTAFVIDEMNKRAIFLSEEKFDTENKSEDWDIIDIQEGLPVLLPQNCLNFIPQALNLHCIEQAISFKKGCYIGQEMIARAKYRGANKRAMFTLVGDTISLTALPEISSSVEMQLGENWKTTGSILYTMVYENKLWIQVVLNKDIELESIFRVNGVLLTIYPLPYVIE